MIDYNKPWGWAQPEDQQGGSNTVAPLGGGGNTEGAPGVIQTGPSMQDQMVSKVGGALATKAVDGAAKGASEYMSGAAGEAAGSMAGPLGAAVGGAMKGEYDEAAGAALGSVLGAYFGPIGSMVGAKVGGYAGNAVGSMFGMADGNPQVKKPEPTPGFIQSIWNKMVEKGAEAVKASTGNDGGVGQAKQALVSRKERLDAEIRKAEGYADGTVGAGGKGATQAGAPQMQAQGGAQGKGAQGGSQPGGNLDFVNRPAGFSGATGYYGELGQPTQNVSKWAPVAGFTPSNQPAPIVQQQQPTPQQQSIWMPPAALTGGYGGGDSAGEGGGSGVGGGAGNGIGGVGDSSGSGIGNGAEGDSAGPGGDAGAGGGGAGGK